MLLPLSLVLLYGRWYLQILQLYPRRFCYTARLQLVLTDATAATGFTSAPHPLVPRMLRRRNFTRTPLMVVLADAATLAVFTPVPLLLVLADFAVATLFALCTSSLDVAAECLCEIRQSLRPQAHLHLIIKAHLIFSDH